MKKLFAGIILAFLLSNSLTAQTNTNSPLSYNAGVILMSKYYGTIFGGTFYNGPMSFWDANAVYKNRFGDFTATIMAGQKLDRLNTYNVDGGTEYDAGFDQTFTFGGPKYPIKLDVGCLYLFVTDLGKTHDDFFDETIRIDFPIRADRKDGPLVQPYYQIFHYHYVGDGLKDGGWISYAGLIRDQKLGLHLFGNELKLRFDYRMGINLGVLGSKPGIEYHRWSLSLPITKGKWTFTPEVLAQIPGGRNQTWVTEKNENFYGNLSIRYNF